MKKILSLIALLVTAVTAFAQTFTDKSVVTVSYSTSTMMMAELEVTDKGDGTFDVLFKDVDNVSGNYTDEYGDVGFTGLTASTENGITTLTGSNLDATTFTGAGHGYIGAAAKIGNANITVKFNAEKAYALLEAKYMQLGFGVGATFNITFGEDNFATPEPPVTGGGTKILEDNFAPNGTAIPAKAFSVNWDSQKIVAHLDMTAEDGENCNIMSFSDNESDVAEWNVQNGYTLHFFYTKNSNLWTASGWMQATNCFTIQFRNVTTTDIPTVYINNIEDPSNVEIEITKEGIYVNGELKMEASQIEAFYTKSDLFFGALQGDARSKAVYKLLEVQDTENGGGSQEPEIEGTVVEGSKDFNPAGEKFEWSNIPVDWNKQKLVAVLDLSTCGDMTANENILSVGEDVSAWRIGGWHFYYTKSTGRMKVDYLSTGGSHPLSTAKTDVSAENEVRIEISKENGVTINGEAYLDNYDSDVTGTWQENTEAFWALSSVNIGSKEGANRSNATIKYVTVVDLPEEAPKPVVYTENMVIKHNGTTEPETQATVEITDNGEGNYTVVVKGITDPDGDSVGDLTFQATGTEADGKITYTATDAAATLTENGWSKATVSMTGESQDGKLSAQITADLQNLASQNPDYLYTILIGEQPETPDTPKDGGLIEADYQPNGASWSKSTTIDWDKQYVKAVIDLSTCKNANENILSVGKGISEWAAYPHYHFYYTASSKSLQFNGMMPDNKSRYDITLDSDELTIEISKKEGLKINGTQYLNQYNTATQYADIDAYLEACAPFFALTEIEFGGCQGETMSNATYKYFNVLDLPKEEVTVVSSKDYTDQVVVENIDTNEKVKNETYVLTINEMSDGSQQLVFKNLPISATETADYTVNCNLTWSDGDNGTKKVTLNEENTSIVVDGKECALYGNALINNDGSLYVYGLLGAVDYSKDLVKIWFGTVKTTDGISSVSADVEAGNAEVYTVGGAKVNGLKKGVNIVRLANGKTVKIIK